MSRFGLNFALPLARSASLLAQGRVASLGDRFRNRGELDWAMMFYIVIALAVAIVIVWMVSRHLSLRESGGYHNHFSLFRELCRAHRLSWGDRRMLVLVARQQGIVVPARLFLEPERFDPARLKGVRPAHLRRVARLREVLFRPETASESSR